MKREFSFEELEDRVGQPIGCSDWLVVDQARIDRFAECTLDHQWIHTDPKRAADGPFGKTIAHGFLTLSLIPYLGGQLSIRPAGSRMTINYGFDRVRLIAPVTEGAAIRDRLMLKAVTRKGMDRILTTTEHTIEIQGTDKPALVADLLAMYIV